MFFKTLLNILCLFMLFICQQGCTSEPVKKISYPFIANPQRKEEILSGEKKIRIEMTLYEVVKIMGEPDEINNVYVGIKSYKEIGFSYVYLLQRKKENGSINEKDEKLIRLIFGNDKKLIRIDKW